MGRKLLTLFFLLLILFPLASADEAPLDRWWVGKPIREFVYIDLHSIDSARIDSFTKALLNTPYSQEAIDRLQRELLNSRNFLLVEIIPARYKESREELTLFIEFMEKQKLHSIEFVGNTFISTDELTDAVNLTVGEVFDTEQVDKSVQAIKRLYQTKGYDRVDVIPSYESDTLSDEMVISFNLTEYEWFLQKPIKGFTYIGLKNVSKNSLDDLLYPYIDKPYNPQLYQELENKLNELMKFSLVQAEAKRGGSSRRDLYIEFTLTELPVIASVGYKGNSGVKSRVLDEEVTLKKGEFLSITKVNATKEALLKLYKKRGYADISIDSSYTIDQSTNMVELIYTISEGPQTKIREIEFVGNKSMSSSSLRKEISSKVQSLFNSGNYESAKVSTDAQDIVLAYQKRGFIDADVVDTSIEELESDDESVKRVKLTFVIEEGEQWFYGGLTVEGNTIFSDDKIYALLYMKEGSLLDMSKVQNEISMIADLYWNEGYVENTIDVQEFRDEKTKQIFFNVTIGERAQAIVEEVLIRGLTKTKPYVLERELALKAGDIFSKEKYILSARNLYNTGLLTNVEPDISYGTQPNSLVVTYKVEEGNQMNIGFGATFGGNVEGFPVSGFLSWSDTNVGGTGRDLEIMTELSPNSQTVSLGFSDTWVKDKRWSNAVNLSFNRSTYKNGRVLADHSPTTELRDSKAFPKPYLSYQEWYDLGSPTPDAEYLMPYEYLKISLGYTTGYTFVFSAGRLSLSLGPSLTLNRAFFDSDVYTPYDFLIAQYGERWAFSNRVGFGVTWDGRDLIANPTKGYVLSQNFVYAGGVLGGLSNYMRSSTSASAFLKLFEIPGEKPTPGVVSLNTTVSFMFDQFFYKEGSWIKGMSASKYEYLYIDGITLARGISPEFYFEFLWDSSLEFSIQIAENVLWGEAFVSATGATDKLSSVGKGPLSWYFAAGFGIRLKVPGFPLGLYMVKNAHKIGDNEFVWEPGSIFHNANRENSGLKLVLAITTNIY